MADFRARVLGVLDRIYKFTSSKTYTSKLDLNSPIQLVHDVSREAELGGDLGRFGGWVLMGSTYAHVGASTENAVFEPYANMVIAGNLTPYPITEDEIDIWLFDLAVRFDAENLTQCTAAIAYPAMEPRAVTAEFPLFYTTQDNFFFTDYAGSADVRLGVDSNTQRVYAQTNYPRYIPHGARISLRSISTGAMGIDWFFFGWVGKAGTQPPGRR